MRLLGTMFPVSIDDLADRLYGMAPEDFTPLPRDQAAKDAERRTSARPSRPCANRRLPAYVVNMLAKQPPGRRRVRWSSSARSYGRRWPAKGDIRALSEERP